MSGIALNWIDGGMANVGNHFHIPKSGERPCGGSVRRWRRG
jgi:hypothetical protein